MAGRHVNNTKICKYLKHLDEQEASILLKSYIIEELKESFGSKTDLLLLVVPPELKGYMAAAIDDLFKKKLIFFFKGYIYLVSAGSNLYLRKWNSTVRDISMIHQFINNAKCDVDVSELFKKFKNIYSCDEWTPQLQAAISVLLLQKKIKQNPQLKFVSMKKNHLIKELNTSDFEKITHSEHLLRGKGDIINVLKQNSGYAPLKELEMHVGEYLYQCLNELRDRNIVFVFKRIVFLISFTSNQYHTKWSKSYSVEPLHQFIGSKDNGATDNEIDKKFKKRISSDAFSPILQAGLSFLILQSKVLQMKDNSFVSITDVDFD